MPRTLAAPVTAAVSALSLVLPPHLLTRLLGHCARCGDAPGDVVADAVTFLLDDLADDEEVRRSLPESSSPPAADAGNTDTAFAAAVAASAGGFCGAECAP